MSESEHQQNEENTQPTTITGNDHVIDSDSDGEEQSSSNEIQKFDPIPREKLEIDLESPHLDLAHHPHEAIGLGYPLSVNLQFLDLTNCRLKKIENLDHLVNLQSLLLRQNLIEKVEGLKGLKSLVHLDLYGNQIKRVDVNELNHLQNLEILDLSFNKLRHMVKGLKMPLLRELYYVNNKIKEIEEDATKGETELPSLELLELGSNRLREIKNLEKFTNLKQLWLGKNKITEIKGLDTLTQLIRLSLQSNRIKKIENINLLTQLTELYLSENGIETIEGLDTLTNLVLIDLAQNFIKQIGGLDTLTQLEELWINDNQLETFKEVEKLVNLPQLTSVYFRSNLFFNDPQYKRKIILILPNVTTIDGFPVIKK